METRFDKIASDLVVFVIEVMPQVGIQESVIDSLWSSRKLCQERVKQLKSQNKNVCGVYCSRLDSTSGNYTVIQITEQGDENASNIEAV